jgi:hypothetical protein
MPRMAVVSASSALVETVVTTGNGGETGIRAAEVLGGSDGDAATEEVTTSEEPRPDIDTRLLRLRDLRKYEWEMGGRCLKARRRGGGAVLGAWTSNR